MHNIWVLNIFVDEDKNEFFKALEFHSLKEVADVLECKVYEVSNFYHKIKKPKNIFKYLYLYKSQI